LSYRLPVIFSDIPIFRYFLKILWFKSKVWLGPVTKKLSKVHQNLGG
jgi:hypothetical protein